MAKERIRAEARRGCTTESVSSQQKRPQTPQARHGAHQSIVRPVQDKGPHRYELYCVECRKHIQWVTRALYDAYLDTHIQK